MKTLFQDLRNKNKKFLSMWMVLNSKIKKQKIVIQIRILICSLNWTLWIMKRLDRALKKENQSKTLCRWIMWGQTETQKISKILGFKNDNIYINSDLIKMKIININ